MNEHLVPAEAGGHIFRLGISRRSLRIAGLYAVSAGALGSVFAYTLEPFRIPLGIALSVLAIVLLIAYAASTSSRKQVLVPQKTERAKEYQVMVGRKSLVAELALLAELHGRGALSDEEFTVAKRRILGSR